MLEQEADGAAKFYKKLLAQLLWHIAMLKLGP